MTEINLIKIAILKDGSFVIGIRHGDRVPAESGSVRRQEMLEAIKKLTSQNEPR